MRRQSLSRQTSLVEDRIDDSDEDEFQEERSGIWTKNTQKSIFFSFLKHIYECLWHV